MQDRHGRDPDVDETTRFANGGWQRNPLLWTLAGTALGLGLLYASTRQVDWAALLATLQTVEWIWVPGVLGATPCFIAIKAWRWRILLRFVPGIRFRELHAAVYLGLAVNYLVAHVGEFLRSAIVAGRRCVPVSAVFATVLVERALDFIALLALLALVFAIAPELPEAVAVAGAVTGAIAAIAIAGLYLLLHRPEWLNRSAVALSRPLPERLRSGLLRQLDRSRPGLAAIKNPRLMVVAVMVSVVQWSFVVVAIWCSSLAVGESVSLIAATLTFVLVIVGLALPSSPMQLGTTQLAFVVGLGTDGTHATAAIAASLIYTSFLIIPVMMVGGMLALRGRPAA